MNAENLSQETRVCQHGVPLRSFPNWSGGWMGGVSECSCCFSVFGYIDSGSFGATGGKSSSWQPRNLCAMCGGKYVETAWGDQS
jgi:hypothetical protein